MNTTPFNHAERTYAARDVESTLNAYKAYEAHKAAYNRKPEDLINKVIFNDPATIVYWKDSTKTVVKAENEPFDPEKGLAMAFAKRFLGNQGNYYNVFRKWLPEEKQVEQTSKKTEPCLAELLTSKQLAEKMRLSISTVLRDCRRGLYQGAQKVDGKWLIPYPVLTRDTEEKDDDNTEILTAHQFAEKVGLTFTAVLNNCRKGLYPGAVKVDGKWLIPYSEHTGGDKNDKQFDSRFRRPVK